MHYAKVRGLDQLIGKVKKAGDGKLFCKGFTKQTIFTLYKA